MEPHQERVVAELADLQGKIDRLETFFKTTIYNSLEKAETDRLVRQLHHMEAYADILRERIAAFK